MNPVRENIGAWCNGNTWVSKTFVEGSSPSAPANGTSFERDWFFLLLSYIPHQGLIHFIKAIAIQVNVKVIGDIHISVPQEA